MNYDSPAACGTFLGIACLSSGMIAIIALIAAALLLTLFAVVRKSKRDMVS